MAYIPWRDMEIREALRDFDRQLSYETWIEYPNYSAFDEDDEKTKEFAKNPESNN